MGTRSRIGISISATKVTSIFCHWDGYPTFNGAILLKYYTKREDVEALMKLGNLSCLGRSPVDPDASIMAPNKCDPTEEFTTKNHEENKANDTMGYPFCISHAFISGDDDKAFYAITHPCDNWPSSDEKYEYRFTRKGTWSYRRVGRKKFMPLTIKSVTNK